MFEEGRDQFDLVVEQGIGSQISAKLSATNLLAADYRFTQGGDLLRGWQPGRAFSLGLTWQPIGDR